MLAALCAWPGAASAADYYNVQIFAMGGGGKMYVIDFHYASRKACTDALDARARAFQQQYPDYTKPE